MLAFTSRETKIRNYEWELVSVKCFIYLVQCSLDLASHIITAHHTMEYDTHAYLGSIIRSAIHIKKLAIITGSTATMAELGYQANHFDLDPIHSRPQNCTQ